MAVSYSVDVRNDRLDVVRDRLDAGAGAGVIKIYDGARPATGGAITTQTLLVSGTFSDPSAPNASSGVLTFSAITYGNGLADGTAAWARLEDSTGTFVADLSVGVTGSGAEIEINSTAILTGGTVTDEGATITAGNA